MSRSVMTTTGHEHLADEMVVRLAKRAVWIIAPALREEESRDGARGVPSGIQGRAETDAAEQESAPVKSKQVTMTPRPGRETRVESTV